MGDIDIIFGLIFALLLQILWALLVLTPPVAIWRSLSRQTSGRAALLHPALALLGPFIAAFVVSVLFSLPYYSGQCVYKLVFDRTVGVCE
jgi:Na+/proline symporter